MTDADSVEAFIATRQPMLLAHAVQVLRDCPEDDLGSQVHRLIGTLGAYRLAEVSARLARVEPVIAAAHGDAPALAQARAAALAAVQPD